jgi:hypothetical protein
MIQNISKQKLFITLYIFSSLVLLFATTISCLPIYAQQAYENPREANELYVQIVT